MKKVILMAAVAVMAAACGEKEHPTANYEWNLEVTNGTDKEIVVTNSASGGYGDIIVPIAPGESGTVGGLLYRGPVESNSPMQDTKEPDDILPFGDATLMLLPEGEYWLEMTVGGEAVPGKVWTRKHWSFSSDNFSCTYSLTITDEFLAGLESPEPQR